MKKRALKVVCMGMGILSVGLLYAILCQKTSIRLPCLFYKFTHLYCPGCGVTRMALSLLDFDLKGAAQNNLAIFLMLPIGGILLVKWIYGYILLNRIRFNPLEEGILLVMLIVLIIFGIMRNMACFSFLQPI